MYKQDEISYQMPIMLARQTSKKLAQNAINL
jgi:hypothetical protein